MDIPIEQVLSQLARTFTVREIMVPASDLTRAANTVEADQELNDHPEFDIIPMPKQGRIGGYFSREDSGFHPIKPIDLLSDGTSLLDLPELLVNRRFFFVLSATNIEGLLHFSDLNRSLMKLPLFVLYEAVERHLWSAVQASIREADLDKVLDPARTAKVIKRRNRKRKKDVDIIGWTGLFSFDEIVAFSIFYGKVKLSSTDRETLANYRNRIAHSDIDLIEDHKDIHKLVKAKELCQSLLTTLRS